MHRPLRFSLRELAEGEQHRELTLSAADLDLPAELPVEGPIVVRLSLRRAGDQVHVRATVRLQAELRCVRCTQPIEREIATRCELVAERPAERDPSNPEAPNGILYYDGEAFDLTEEIRQEALLAIPTHPLCSEACRGLCPRCGRDRNRERCDCAGREPSDPRWAALAQLRAREAQRDAEEPHRRPES
ncbi:MAG: hypothetical protein GF330_11375 [Candidatus Eisenbacteria bacterium]|nr:hypothetical protein [Candidatus Eisenbacteria bacterium]